MSNTNKRSWTEEKKFYNSRGTILVRASDHIGRCGIVEMLNLYDNHKSGYVIGYWEERLADGHPIAEFTSVHDRVMKTEYDNPQILLDALQFGQELANQLSSQSTIDTPESTKEVLDCGCELVYNVGEIHDSNCSRGKSSPTELPEIEPLDKINLEETVDKLNEVISIVNTLSKKEGQ